MLPSSPPVAGLLGPSHQYGVSSPVSMCLEGTFSKAHPLLSNGHNIPSK